MILRRIFLTAVAGAAVGCREPGPFGYPGLAFVATESGVAIVDLRRFSVQTHLKLEDSPRTILAHPAEPRVYALGAKTGTIFEIDASSLSLSRKSRAATSAASMKFSPDFQSLWVFAPQDRRLVRVSLLDFRTVADHGIPPGAEDFDVSQSRGFGATSHPSTGIVTLLDLDKRSFSTIVHLGGAPRTVRFRSDGNMLLIANTQDRVLTSLLMPGGRVVSSLPLAVRPDHLCFSTDNGQLFITGEGADACVVVFPYPFPEVAETVLAGSGPAAMGASTQYLFITNPGSGDVSILDIASRKVIAVAPVGSEPSLVAVTPANEFALVLNRKSGDMAVIRIGSIRAERDKRAPILTIIPVGAKPAGAAIRSPVL